MKNLKNFLVSTIISLGVIVLALSLTSVAKATPPQHNQVRLCHHTEGGHYNDITIDDDAVFQQGHDQHQGGQDIIPPFNYQVWEITS